MPVKATALVISSSLVDAAASAPRKHKQHCEMNKVVVDFVESTTLKQRAIRRSATCNNRPLPSTTPHREVKTRYEGWVPADYRGEQLRHDVAHFWQLDATKYELLENVAHAIVTDETLLDTLAATQFTLRKRRAVSTHVHDLQQQTAARKNDPFWLQEKLFDIFLVFALPHWNGKGAVTVSCYHFKQLILKATKKAASTSTASAPSSLSKKATNTQELIVRVVLAFKTATPNYNGAGASFDEFLDALVDVASYLFPRASSSESNERALELLATRHLIPFVDSLEQETVHYLIPSWSSMDELVLARPKATALLQRYAHPLREIALAYSTSNSGPRHLRGLQFHELSRFVHDIKPSSVPLNALELCFCFIHCCRIDLADGFAKPGTRRASSRGGASLASLNNSGENKNGSARGVLEISCAHVVHVIAYLSLLAMPRLALTRTPSVHYKQPVLGGKAAPQRLSSSLAVLSIKSFLHFMSLRLASSGRATAIAVAAAASPRFASMKKDTTLPLVSVNFLQEFSRMHRDDGLDDYVSSCGEMVLRNDEKCRRAASSTGDAEDEHHQQRNRLGANGDGASKDETQPEQDEDVTGVENASGNRVDLGLGLEIDWGDAISETSGDGQNSPNGENSPESVCVATLTPLELAQQRAHESKVLRSMLNDADEIYAFLAAELHQHAIDKRLENAENVPQMLDIWVAAGQKYAQVVSYLESLYRTAGDDAATSVMDRKARVLEQFGNSLYVFAMQLLKSTTKVFRYEELFHVTNARVYDHAKAELWDDGHVAAFPMDLATETLSLASGKLGQACTLIEELLQVCVEMPSEEDSSEIRANLESDSDLDAENGDQGGDSESDDERTEPDDDDDGSGDKLTVESLTERYMQCLLQRANCLNVYGDLLAHNKPCAVDFDLGCALEEDHELEQMDSIHAQGTTTTPSPGTGAGLDVNGVGALTNFYLSAAVLSKTSSAGQFYREAKRIYRFLLAETHRLGWNNPGDRWVPAIHDRLATVEFKLATHLPRGCVAEKRLLDDAVLHLTTLQRLDSAITRDHIDAKKEYMVALRALRAKFFQPETDKSTTVALDGESIVPLYRFVLVAAIRELDPHSTGLLTQSQLSQFNKLCGREPVEESVMKWLMDNFDHQSERSIGEYPQLTEKGLFQYFCWLAEADPLTFCTVLDTLTAKHTETSASITSGIISQAGRQQKGKSLRATLFSQGRSASLMSATSTFGPKAERLNGIADCVVIVSTRMTAESCGDIALTASPCDVRLEPMVLDVLPLGSDVPEELSKFCFPDDPFMSNEPLPAKTFDIVLTDITGARRYGSCLQFFEERDPIDVLAMISGIQRGSQTASLPSWISLKDIQQRKAKAKCYLPKCVCILSSEPLFQTFRDCLAVLYRLSISMPPFPIESFLLNMLEQIPVPTTANSVTSFGLVDRIGLLSALPPAAPPLYPSEVDFTLLVQSLSAENIVKVYGFLLTERKVVLCSQNLSILTPIAETFRALLFPFDCQVVYIPVLPLALLDFVTAPVPFFMGVRSDHSIDRLTSEGVVVVYLDRDEVAEPATETLPALPDVRAKKLLQGLRKASTWAAAQTSRQQYGRFQHGQLSEITSFPSLEATDNHIAMLVQQHEDLLEKWTELHLLFTTFAMRLLKDFRKFCHRSTSSDGRETTVFDKKAFLVMHPSQREFCVQLFQTQLFQRFIDTHTTLSDSILQLAASDAEQSWRNVRAKSMLGRRNDSNNDADSAKYQPRKITRAPAPPRFTTGSSSGSLSTPTHRRRHSGRHASIEILASFSSHIYNELKGSSSSSSTHVLTEPTKESRGSSTAIPSRPALLSHGSSGMILPLPRGSLHVSGAAGHASSSNLIVAARLRLDTPMEAHESK